MPLDPRSILKTYFETGDVPTEDQFENLIDSSLRMEVGYGATISEHFLELAPGAGGFLQDSLGDILLLSEGEIVSGALGPGEAYLPRAEIGLGSGLPGNSAFLGMSFELSDSGLPETHYGFLQLTVNGAGGASPYAIELTGFAYETDPGVPIATFAIPEPGTGLLLMIGLTLAALFGGRRRRTELARS